MTSSIARSLKIRRSSMKSSCRRRTGGRRSSIERSGRSCTNGRIREVGYDVTDYEKVAHEEGRA